MKQLFSLKFFICWHNWCQEINSYCSRPINISIMSVRSYILTKNVKVRPITKQDVKYIWIARTCDFWTNMPKKTFQNPLKFRTSGSLLEHHLSFALYFLDFLCHKLSGFLNRLGVIEVPYSSSGISRQDAVDSHFVCPLRLPSLSASKMLNTLD